MRILVACEESQAVTIELRKLGHEAFSCDIIECSGGHPEWHIIGDVLPLLNGFCNFETQDRHLHAVWSKWDMIIAHPPCTYMSNAGACRMYPTKGNIDNNRLLKGLAAKEFFMKFMNADCDKIAIENPRPLKIIGLPVCNQIIQPYQFGDPFSKLTMLWLKGLNELKYTNVLKEWKPYIASGTSRNKGKTIGQHFANGSSERSKTFPGIAKAMAEQWT